MDCAAVYVFPCFKNLADVYLLFCTNFKKISGRIADNMLMFFVKAGIDFMKKTGRCKRKV